MSARGARRGLRRMLPLVWLASIAVSVAAAAAIAPQTASAQQALSPEDAAYHCAQPVPAQRDWLERCVAFDVTGSRQSAKLLIEPCLGELGPDLERCLTGRIAAFVTSHPVGTMPVQIAPPTPKPRPTPPPPPRPLVTAAPAPAPAADLRPLTLAAVVLAFAAGLGLGLTLRRA